MELTLKDIKLNNYSGVASCPSYSFMDMTNIPPKGVDLLLLTRYGCMVRGKWKKSDFYKGWCPLPSTPSHMKYSM